MLGLSGWGSKKPEKGPVQEAADDVTTAIQSMAGKLEDAYNSQDRLPFFHEAADGHILPPSIQIDWNVLRSPPVLVSLTLGTTAASYAVYRRYFRRIPTAGYLTPSTLRYRRVIVGRCLSVGDADGFRLYHTPGPPLYRKLAYGNIKASGNGGSGGGGPNTQKETISVRLAGADAPESSHFGKPAQPLSKEAKEELVKLVLGRQVWCQMAHIDQYQRLVATPYVWLSPYIFGRTNVSLHLVKRGLATVYTSAGAAYGTAGPFARFLRWLLGVDSSANASEKNAKTAILDRLIPLSGEARLRRAQAKAKRKKIGVWGLKNFESPEDYKKRMRQQQS